MRLRKSLLFLAALFFAGCTTADKDYIREHVATLSHPNPAPTLAQSAR